MLSSMSSHSRPTPGICTKWSITEIDENPASSAARAMTPSRWAVSAGAPGHVNLPICSPKRMDIGSSCCRAAAIGASNRRCGTTTTGSSDAWWTAAKPSSSMTLSAAARARSWLVTTEDGTASGLSRLRVRVSRSGVSMITAWHGTPALSARAR